jgi:hypothetical protein
MSSKLRHGLLISIIVIALFFAVEYGYGTTIEYTYDEAGNLIEKRIRADDPGLPTGRWNRVSLALYGVLMPSGWGNKPYWQYRKKICERDG